MERRYVGIDLHRRRSVIYAMNAEGNKLFCERIANEPMRLLEVINAAGEHAEVVIEATYGWYRAVDLLQEAGFSVHLAHPSGNRGKRRVKNDERDARDLADLLRLGRLADAWIAPLSVREARELLRYRARLVQLRSGLKAQVHAVMPKEGRRCPARRHRHVRPERPTAPRRDETRRRVPGARLGREVCGQEAQLPAGLGSGLAKWPGACWVLCAIRSPARESP